MDITQVFQVLQNIFDMLVTLFDFLLGFIEDIVYVATLLPDIVSDVSTLITSFIPAPVLSIILACVTLTVVYRVLGRD